MLSIIKNYLKKRKIKNKKENNEFLCKLKDKSNMNYNFRFLIYSLQIVILIIFIVVLILNPLNIYKEFYYIKSIDDNSVQSVVNYCKSIDSDSGKIYCVNNYVNRNFQYVDRIFITTPDKTIKEGSDCKGWSNFYLTTLRLMNISVSQDYNSVKAHTFIIAETSDGYCTIDQMSVNCNTLG